MQMNGSAKLSAPKANSVTITLNASNSASSEVHSTGDTYVTTAYTAGGTGLVVNSIKGFPSPGGTLIIGYGTANQEEVAYSTSSSSTITITAALKNHAVNERVINKPAYTFVPGTLSIKEGSTVIATDDGVGGLTASGGAAVSAGSVDYSTGSLTFTFDSGLSGGNAVTCTVDTMTDAPDAESALANGGNALKTYQQYSFTRNDVPGAATVANLGDAAVGFFFEVSRNGGKSFTTKGYGASAGVLGTMNRKTVTLPNGGDMVVRFRAGSSSTASSSETAALGNDPDRRIVEPRVVTVDTATILNNG